MWLRNTSSVSTQFTSLTISLYMFFELLLHDFVCWIRHFHLGLLQLGIIFSSSGSKTEQIFKVDFAICILFLAIGWCQVFFINLWSCRLCSILVGRKCCTSTNWCDGRGIYISGHVLIFSFFFFGLAIFVDSNIIKLELDIVVAVVTLPAQWGFIFNHFSLPNLTLVYLFSNEVTCFRVCNDSDTMLHVLFQWKIEPKLIV